MRWREVLILVLFGAVLGGCALVDDEPGQVASGPPTSDLEALDQTTVGPGASTGPGSSTPPAESSTTTIATATTLPPTGAVPDAPVATDPGVSPPSSPTDQSLPPVCQDMAKFMIQSAEVLRVRTTAEALEWLRSLRVTVRSLETTGGTELGGSARALGVGIDRAFDELDPSAPIQETHRTIQALSSGVAGDTDRLVSQGVGACGGSQDPILSTVDGVKALTGV